MVSFGLVTSVKFHYVPGWTKAVMGAEVLPYVDKATKKVAASAHNNTPVMPQMRNSNYMYYSHIDGHGFARGVVFTANPYAVNYNKKYNTLLKACNSLGGVI